MLLKCTNLNINTGHTESNVLTAISITGLATQGVELKNNNIDVYMGIILVQWLLGEVAVSTFGPVWAVFIYRATCLNLKVHVKIVKQYF